MNERDPGDASPAVLQMVEVSKSFGGVPALRGVSFAVAAGRVHALVGENGAGKSTLVKIVSGVVRPDAGAILLDGERVAFAAPGDAANRGIHLVHQELALLGEASVTENVFLGAELRGRARTLDRARMRRQTRTILERLGSRIDPRARVAGLSVAQRQLVEIGRALVGRVRVLILDEPTAALSPEEAAHLFATLRGMRDAGCAVVYISHRIGEVLDLADEVTVLKDGRLVETRPATALSVPETVRLMVGRPVEALFPPRATEAARGTPLLAVGGLVDPPHVLGVDLALYPGEIVGVAGLEGHGQDQLLACLAGDRHPAGGRLEIGGRRTPWSGVGTMVRRGIGLVPEDRKTQGLLLDLSSRRNIALPALRSVSRRGWVRRRSEERLGEEGARAVGVRGDTGLPAASLSGGNQQKVVLAKWLAVGSRVLLLNQPTRGVDVGAKSEIYALLRAFAEGGGAALVTSRELTEILGLCDRVLVIRHGRFVAELPGGAAEEDVMAAAVGA